MRSASFGRPRELDGVGGPGPADGLRDRRARGIESLPGSLEKALEAMEGSTLIREALGEHIFTKFLANKHMEWDQYRSQVTNYELERYLPRL